MSLLHSKMSLGGISHTFMHTHACRHTGVVEIKKKQEKSSFLSIMSEERQNQHMYSLLKNKKFLVQVTERLFILLLLLGLLLLLFLLFVL